MPASTASGLGRIWPADDRARGLAVELYQSVATSPLTSLHNGLPARFLAEDLPFTDPVSLLIAHDQGVQALLRANGIRTEFSPTNGWQTEHASRRAFVLLQRHRIDVLSRSWVKPESNEVAELLRVPLSVSDSELEQMYDALAARLANSPVYPRRVLAAANIRLLATSDDPADDLQAHRVLTEDSMWAGRVVPTFSPDRYLDPGRRSWLTDADLLAEITGIGTEGLSGFLEALRHRRNYFIASGAIASEHHTCDLGATRLAEHDAADLFQLARSGELLPDEALALQRHLLWEMGRLAAEDGLVMALYPPAGFRPGGVDRSVADDHDDRGIADRLRPLLTSFGSAPRFRLWLFSIDAEAYAAEIVPLAAEHAAVTAVPPSRFADDPVVLRAVRVAAVEALGSDRSLGVVDDMSGPFALAPRHGLARRLDAGALAELVVAGALDADRAQAELRHAVGQAAFVRLTASPGSVPSTSG